jgi:RNA recognition motif-containing protein
MSKNLFVGSLSWDTSDDSLRQAFARFGEILEAKVILDRDSGRSRGFGFITFANPTEGEAAIREMDGTVLDNRTIKVNEAQDKPRREHHGGPQGGRGGFGGRSGREHR